MVEHTLNLHCRRVAATEGSSLGDVDHLLLGSLLTLLVSLIAAAAGARLQATREHRLRVREKRYEHVVRVLKVATRDQWEETNGAKIREVQEQAARLHRPLSRRGSRKRLAAEIASLQHDVAGLDDLAPRYIELLEAVRELAFVAPPHLAGLGIELVTSTGKPQVGPYPPFVIALTNFTDAARKVIKAGS
ncbi:hypothetical protein GSU68_03000 [Rathayibacter sp. VKM Ac-2759]|uniref:hypothetical protein n=1 Tax=Rathayibacter sp. VKM Ac-2759 TaxID=2609252 RepID=UPI00131710FF|nr:hypothetical protein [Rathayibacter sp. VKM Ac-2759]QHC65648.1 hypothetical protein GSU68_03000 [Rathayibacter sp. VKM Ac-2759]